MSCSDFACTDHKRPHIVKARQALSCLVVCHTTLPTRQVALHLGVQPYTIRRCAAAGEQALTDLGCTATEIMAAIVPVR